MVVILIAIQNNFNPFSKNIKPTYLNKFGNVPFSHVYSTNYGKTVQNNVSNNAKKVVSSNSNTFEGVCFSTKPVSGTITSRFGNKESIRTSAHKGIDIGAPNGTQIKAASDGTVTFARIYYRWIWKPCCYISWK